MSRPLIGASEVEVVVGWIRIQFLCTNATYRPSGDVEVV
jgi:hypothetical protein